MSKPFTKKLTRFVQRLAICTLAIAVAVVAVSLIGGLIEAAGVTPEFKGIALLGLIGFGTLCWALWNWDEMECVKAFRESESETGETNDHKK